MPLQVIFVFAFCLWKDVFQSQLDRSGLSEEDMFFCFGVLSENDHGMINLIVVPGNNDGFPF